ncbi:MAG: polyphosphate polymerase domain-containing protein [Lachnospiraceae bacterium]|nr:polyphosphate polymerase domain-containing protein [Lachnospiraceae bacterium]
MTNVNNPIVVMQRYELKYILSSKQEVFLRKRLEGHMEPDQYGRTSIASLYYDTPDSRLINTSIEKPVFKEKLRLRSYGLATDRSPVYLELKRKAYGIVYKRRVQTTVPDAERFLNGGRCGNGSQIDQELSYFRDMYGDLKPACMIIYDRTAFYEPGGDLRLTIDNAPRYRLQDLDLRKSMDGIPLLPEGYSILEIKVQEAMPLWLSKILDEGKIYMASFSKYGEAYRTKMQMISKGGY